MSLADSTQELTTSRGTVRRSADGWGFGLYDGDYRYWFRTKVDPTERAMEDPMMIQKDGLPRVQDSTLVWVGLNPSWSDDGSGSRMTLLNVLHWAHRDGFTEVLGVNLYAWRHTDPRRLTTRTRDEQARMIGTHNDDVLRHVLAHGSVLAAWGSKGARLGRGSKVLTLIQRPLVIGLCANGEPQHPARKPRATMLRNR